MGYKVISTEMTTKELLDKATTALMAEKGQDFTVRDICRRAGVSIGTFYSYYKNKDAVILARLDQIDNALLELYASFSQGSYAEHLQTLLTAYVKFAILYGYTLTREQFRCVLMAETPPEESRKRPFYQILRELIEGGQQTGEFSDAYTADFLTDATIAFARGLIYNWCHQGGVCDLAETAEPSFALWLRTLCPQDRPDHVPQSRSH